MTTEAALLEAVYAAGPGDFAQLAYADFLEENGRGKEAEAWRWLHAERRWPTFTDLDGVTFFGWMPRKKPKAKHRTFFSRNEQAVLPPRLYRRVMFGSGPVTIYESLSDALATFILAFTHPERPAARVR